MNQTAVDTKKLETIIKGGDVDSLIHYAQQIGERAANADLGTSQVRNIYGMVKQIQTQSVQTQSEPDYGQLKLLVPKLHYVAARQPALKEMAAVLSEAIWMVEDREAFKQFASLFEAIVAYHSAAYIDRKGGR